MVAPGWRWDAGAPGVGILTFAGLIVVPVAVAAGSPVGILIAIIMGIVGLILISFAAFVPQQALDVSTDDDQQPVASDVIDQPPDSSSFTLASQSPSVSPGATAIPPQEIDPIIRMQMEQRAKVEALAAKLQPIFDSVQGDPRAISMGVSEWMADDLIIVDVPLYTADQTFLAEVGQRILDAVPLPAEKVWFRWPGSGPPFIVTRA